MSEMIERVARLLTGERDEADPANNGRITGDDGTSYRAGFPRWKAHAERARDIIAAMREPTEAMWKAEQPVWSLGRPMWEWWRAMIDQAMK